MARTHHHQENISVDGLIDRCLVQQQQQQAQQQPQHISQILNLAFGSSEYDEAFVKKRIALVDDYKHRLDKLLKLPKLEQRTPEWYATRQTLITASDFAQALGDGKFGTRDQLLKKKCGYEEEKFNASSPPLKWGTMFEPVASVIYEQRNKMKLHEFGLLRHPTIDFFGASPDGVNECGIMVEIKCPFRRKIDGTVPLQYFYQIQGQLDVCGLDECDYFECEFAGSEDVDDVAGVVGGEKGAILENAEGVYEYSPTRTDWTAEDLLHWVSSKRNDDDKVLFYRLEKCSTIRVYKDKEFLTKKLEDLSLVWNKILQYRADEDLYVKEIKKSIVATTSYKPHKLTGWAFD